MAQIGLRHVFELETRNRYTKVNAEFALKLDGKELPNTAILGDALDKAVELIQNEITNSYKEVPARDGATPAPAPLAQPKPPEPEREGVAGVDYPVEVTEVPTF